MDFQWISDLKDLVLEGIVYLDDRAPFLSVTVVLLLFLALAARIADLDEIIKACKSKAKEQIDKVKKAK